MMSVSETSQSSYEKIKPELGKRQEEALRMLGELGIASNEQLAEALHLPIQSVTGRITELRKFGYVDVHGLTKNKSGHTAKLWRVCDPNDKKLGEIQ